MDFIGFDDDPPLSENPDSSAGGLPDDDFLSDADLADDEPSDLLIQALIDEGYSRGDIERRFGVFRFLNLLYSFFFLFFMF